MPGDPLEADYNEATLRAIDGDTRARARIDDVVGRIDAVLLGVDDDRAHDDGALGADGDDDDDHHRNPERNPERERTKGSARIAGLALAAATVTGARQALDDDLEDDAAVEIVVETNRRDPAQAVEVIFVPRDPRASVAIVRRWLLPSAS